MKKLMKHGRTVAKAAMASVGLLAISSANAAVPAVVGTEITSMQTDALALVDLIWPLVVAITGAIFLIKIFKRGAAKA